MNFFIAEDCGAAPKMTPVDGFICHELGEVALVVVSIKQPVHMAVGIHEIIGWLGSRRGLK